MMAHMETTDPVLKQLIAQADTDKAAVPLTLYLPWGRVKGYTSDRADFDGYCAGRMRQDATGLREVFDEEGQPSDTEYLHLSRATTWPAAVERHAVLRIRLSDVIAWTIDPPEG